MRRWTVMALGGGASVTSTVYAPTMIEALGLGRLRFVEVNGRRPTLAQASDLGPGHPARAPFEVVAYARL